MQTESIGQDDLVIRSAAAARSATRRWIEIDPLRCGGEPVLNGTRVPADTIAECWDLGQSLDEIARAYFGVDREAVLVCCWSVAQYGTAFWRRAWRRWLRGDRGADLLLAMGVDPAEIPLPPQRGIRR